MDVYVYLIFALSIIPGLASACYIYDYTMLILTKKEKYLDAIKSKSVSTLASVITLVESM